LSFWASSAFKIFEAGLRSLESDFRASSAFKIFEAGLRSLELSFWASSAFKIFEAGLRSLESDFRASSAFEIFEVGLRSLESYFRASSAFEIFEVGLRSLELFLSGQQRLQAIRGWALILQAAFFWSSNAFEEFEYELWAFEPSFSNLSFELSTLLNQQTRVLVAIYQFGCRMSNTKVSPRFATSNGPVFVSDALCWKFSIPMV
jgi:hypothetical protein